MCKRLKCYHSANKKQVTDRIFKLTPKLVSVIYQFPEFSEFPFYLGKTPARTQRDVRDPVEIWSVEICRGRLWKETLKIWIISHNTHQKRQQVTRNTNGNKNCKIRFIYNISCKNAKWFKELKRSTVVTLIRLRRIKFKRWV